MAKNAMYSRADAENAVRDMQRDFDKRIDGIRAELKKGPGAADAVEESLSALKSGFEERLGDMRDSLENARESFDDAVEKSRTTIKDRPLMAVGIAVAAGVLVGLLLGRRGNNRPSSD